MVNTANTNATLYTKSDKNIFKQYLHITHIENTFLCQKSEHDKS